MGVLLFVLAGIAPAMAAGDAVEPGEAAQEQAALKAWELEQKADPKTEAFEQTAPGTYHLKTSRFPYDGVVRVGSIVVHSLPPADEHAASAYAVIEPTLDKDNASYTSQYPESFNDWRGRNYLYYLPDKKAWLTAADYARTRSQPAGKRWLASYFSVYLLIASLLLLIVGLIAQRFREWRLMKSRFNQASNVEQQLLQSAAKAEDVAARQQRLLELNEEQTRLLREILEQLKREH
jgi:hypothetical protein